MSPVTTFDGPDKPLYIVAENLGSFGSNQLVTVDIETWETVARTTIPDRGPGEPRIDPLGRIWLGYGRVVGGSSHLVQAYAPTGKLLFSREYSDCLDPILPLHFARNRIFVTCLQSGFYASVLVVDLNSGEPEALLDIRMPDDEEYFLASNVAGTENEAVVIGSSGEKLDRLVWIDTDTLAVSKPMDLPPNLTGEILTYNGKFLIFRNDPVNPHNLVVIDQLDDPSITFHQLAAPYAYKVALYKASLYAYHNPSSLTGEENPSRAISRFDLETGETELWPLPDNWNSRDFIVADGHVLLTYAGSNDETEGLYELDLETGELIQRVVQHNPLFLAVPD